MKIGIHQPNYVPWCGYFAKIILSDVFIFLDNAEISPGQSYVYRSQIRDEKQAFWLSQPSYRHPGELIQDVEFSNPDWSQSHLARIRQVYRKAPYFPEIISMLTSHYQKPYDRLANFNIDLIKIICSYLDIHHRFEKSSQLKPSGAGDDRLISLVQLTGGDIYVSGKGGQNYQDPEKFARAGIRLEIHTYSPIPYPQIHGNFIGGLSILDLLFNCGKTATKYLKYSE
ncbi:MAG: WbqC family protein [Anaerolineaceae bacterium]